MTPQLLEPDVAPASKKEMWPDISGKGSKALVQLLSVEFSMLCLDVQNPSKSSLFPMHPESLDSYVSHVTELANARKSIYFGKYFLTVYCSFIRVYLTFSIVQVSMTTCYVSIQILNN